MPAQSWLLSQCWSTSETVTISGASWFTFQPHDSNPWFKPMIICSTSCAITANSRHNQILMTRTSLEPWKFVLDMGNSNHWELIIAPGQEENGDITKTRLFKFIGNFTTPKKENFQNKNSDIFHIPAQNIDCGYSLEPHRRGGSKEYPQSMFLAEIIKKIMYTPVNPSFTVRGSKLYRYVFVITNEGYLFDLLYNNCMLSVLIRVAFMRF